MTYPPEAFAALDRLNTWIRAPKEGLWFSSPWRAIYDWKIELIRDAIASEIATLKPVKLTLNCRDCGGDGKYMDSSGHLWPHCRKCSSTGQTTLVFLASQMHGFTWHTPRDKAWRLALPSTFFDSPEYSFDWEPNLPGKPMEVGQVAACLNSLEPIMPKPGCTYSEWGDMDHSKYRLYLGRSPQVCEFCGTVPASDGDGSYHCVAREHIEWRMGVQHMQGSICHRQALERCSQQVHSRWRQRQMHLRFI
jgi:hypothetical protein